MSACGIGLGSFALLRGSEGEVRGGDLFAARLREARRLHQLRKFVLILWRVEAAIKRQPLDSILEALLQPSRFRNGIVLTALGTSLCPSTTMS